MRIVQILETIKLYGFLHLFRRIVFINWEAVPVEKDLSLLISPGSDLNKSENKIIEVTPEMLTQKTIIYTVRNRYQKALHYLRCGYIGFALVRGNRVCGDIWSSALRKSDDKTVHPDIKWLGIQYEDNSVYTFDMYLSDQERGKNLSVMLQNQTLLELRKKGFTKAYGFFWAKNIPALWVHRTLKWKELKRVKVTRFLIFKKVTQ